jgi:hypothetical protein
MVTGVQTCALPISHTHIFSRQRIFAKTPFIKIYKKVVAKYTYAKE